MVKLLIISDDFTGALDSGVRFAAHGTPTKVISDPAYDASKAEETVEVVVVNAESRHLMPDTAYDRVFFIAQQAKNAGIPYIYKKTDSALRGNLGSELSAVMNATETDSMAFLPAFPQMKRITREGVHYIDGVPVAKSAFGQDPFEPVKTSSIPDILKIQTSKPVFIHSVRDIPVWSQDGIHVFDASTDEDLIRISRTLGAEHLHLSAGCAGFAAALAEVLHLKKCLVKVPKLFPRLFVVCGSINPITIQQMQAASEQGVPCIHLSSTQKLDSAWLRTSACAEAICHWLSLVKKNSSCILDTNGQNSQNETASYAAAHQFSPEELRLRISGNLAALTKRLLDEGLEATLMCTGGDTLLAIMQALGTKELLPLCELAPGVVLSKFLYRNKVYHMISKSGGFGEPDLLCKLAERVKA